MEIVRSNFRFNRIIDIDEIMNDSRLFAIPQEDIVEDEFVRNENIGDGEAWLVLQNNSDVFFGERYCYVKTYTSLGGDNQTKLINVDKVILDGSLINRELINLFFTILLQQEDNEFPNRIKVGNIVNCRFHDDIQRVSSEIANYVIRLFNEFTSNHIPIYNTPQ